MRVLIVDDNAANRQLLAELCDAFDWNYETVSDGQECIEIILERLAPFDIIFMDIHMPRASGIEAALAIRQSLTDPPKNVPILAITADVSESNKVDCRGVGINDVIEKPINVQALVKKTTDLVAQAA